MDEVVQWHSEETGFADIMTGMQRGALGAAGGRDGWNEMKKICMNGLEQPVLYYSILYW